MLSVQDIASSINHFVATSQDVKTQANKCLESKQCVIVFYGE